MKHLPLQASAARAAQGTGTAADGDRRPCTQAQKDIVRKIKATKNLYERIGVPRDVDANTLKKAYRKLSMKVHPDKNPAPGAEEAFQMLQKAYGILEDDQKRRYYDQTGEESAQAAAANRGRGGFGGGGFGGPGFQFGRGGRGGVHHVDMDDIFAQFFGAGMQMPGNRHNVNRQQRQQRQNRQQQQGEQGERAQDSMGQFVFVIIMMLSLFSTSFTSTQESLFSFQRSGEFSVARETDTGTKTQYYVRQNFEPSLRRSSKEDQLRTLFKIEYEVDQSMEQHLHRQCQRDKESNVFKARKLQYHGNKKDAKAMAKRTPATCSKYDAFKAKRKHGHGIR